MSDFGLHPAPPAWALAAGLPEPEAGEGFARYVTRLGGTSEEVRRIDSNDALAAWLQREAPAAFRVYAATQGYAP